MQVALLQKRTTMQCSWAFVLVLSICVHLGAGHAVDRSWELPKVRITLGDLSHVSF